MLIKFIFGKKVASLRNTKRSSHLTASYPRFNYSGNAEKNHGSNETASYKRQAVERLGVFLRAELFVVLPGKAPRAFAHILQRMGGFPAEQRFCL